MIGLDRRVPTLRRSSALHRKNKKKMTQPAKHESGFTSMIIRIKFEEDEEYERPRVLGQ
jgi:hypothetical protein